MRRGWLIAVLAAGGGVLGITAAAVSDAGLDEAAADLATGWTLLACGLWGMQQHNAQRRWRLVVAAGLTWFAGNFSASAGLVYFHRGPLVHAVVAATQGSHGRRSPRGSSARSPLALAAVAAGYADALVVERANGWLTIAVIVALVLIVNQPLARSTTSASAYRPATARASGERAGEAGDRRPCDPWVAATTACTSGPRWKYTTGARGEVAREPRQAGGDDEPPAPLGVVLLHPP